MYSLNPVSFCKMADTDNSFNSEYAEYNNIYCILNYVQSVKSLMRLSGH